MIKIFNNIKSKVIQSLRLKPFNTILHRNFESATNGSKFNYPREISPFLTQPTKVSELPYFVRRTQFLSLPVYTDFRNGNTRKLTIIRRVLGDAKLLKEDLSKDFPDWQVYIKPINNHVVVKGLKSHEVRDWLTSKGF